MIVTGSTSILDLLSSWLLILNFGFTVLPYGAFSIITVIVTFDFFVVNVTFLPFSVTSASFVLLNLAYLFSLSVKVPIIMAWSSFSLFYCHHHMVTTDNMIHPD